LLSTMSDNFREVPVKTVIKLGFVPRWMVCGPFLAGNKDDIYRRFRMGRLDAPDTDPLGGERFVNPAPGMSHESSLVPGEEVVWREATSESPFLTLSAQFPGAEHGLAYAATQIKSQSECMLICDFRPRAVGRMFLNQRILSPDRGLVQVPLKAGNNRLLVKVLGGSVRGVGWGSLCKFFQARSVGKTGIFTTGPASTGFYRGTAPSPESEVEFILGNTTGSDVVDIAVSLSCGDVEVSRAIEVIRGRETRRFRFGLPIPEGGFGEDRLKLEVLIGNSRLSLRSAMGDVNPPKEDGMTFLGIGFHCDPIWTNTQSMYNDISLNNVTQYLNFCRADPDYRVILHELDYLKPYLDFYPGDRDYMKRLAKEGRVILGGSYNEPNEKNISGEQLIRNIMYGKLFATSQFGVDPEVYHAWDVFGHIPQLSQILSKCGFKGVVWSKAVRGFPMLFRHMALDGSTVLHRRVHYGFDTGDFDELRERCYSGLAEMKSLGHSVDLRMNSDDFRSPTAWMLGRSAELISLLPGVKPADPAEFFGEILKEESRGIPVQFTSRDASQYHIGTSQSRIELKIANRLGEIGLYNAELLSTLASMLGRPYPDLALDKAWRQLLFNSHHDAITGTSCDKSYLDMLQAYRDALSHVGREVGEALQYIAETVDTSGTDGIPITVFNSLNWDRVDIARARINFSKAVANFKVLGPDGKKVPHCTLDTDTDERGIRSATVEFVAEVPSVGYATYTVTPLEGGRPPRFRNKDGPAEIENEFFKVSVDPSRGGGISSIFDKRSGRELVPGDSDYLANEIALLKEKNERHEPSWEFHTIGDRLFSGGYPAECEVSTCGPVSRIVVRNVIGETCQLVREIYLRRGIDRIDLSTEIRGYRDEDDLFVALFPQDIRGGAPTYEERFGAILRHPGRHMFDYRTWRMDAFSDCAIHSSQNFFDVGSTTKVRFVDTNARTVASAPMGSVLMVLPHSKEVQYISRRLQKALANRGVLTTPVFEDGDAPRREGLPHQDSTEAVEINGYISSTNFRLSLGVAGENSYAVSILEQVDDDRVKEFRNRVAKLGFDFLITRDSSVPEGWDPVPVLLVEARNSESLERAVDFLVEGLTTGDLILPGHSNDLGDVSVDDYGMSIINRGNMTGTVEPDGTMTLFLKHTANWSRVHLEEKFVPERMDHRFIYSLYPHQGSWREASSYRRGWEFNNPLICAQTGKHGGVLPAKHSFLVVSAKNVVLSAMKPAGNPVAGFLSTPSDPNRGILLRAYDAEGRQAVSNFEFAFPIENAWRTDMLEERESPVEISGCSFSDDIKPFSVETYEVEPSSVIRESKDDALPALVEDVQPVYSKYWRENLSAAPLGYQPVAISILGTPITEAGGRGTTVNRISVSIVNDYADRSIEGNAVLEGPEGWRIEPGKIWYEIPPLGHESYDVFVSFSGPRRTGLLRARLTHGGQVYQDVIEIGEQSKITYTGGGSVYQDVLKEQVERELGWSIRNEGNRILVRVENPYNERVQGGVALIGSIGTWSPLEAGDYSISEVTPLVRSFDLPAKTKEVLEFSLADGNAHFWLYAKLFYMGRTRYLRVR